MAKFDVYQFVTDKIISQLEKGEIPWNRPWNLISGDPDNVAVSYSTGRPYSMLNQFLLGGETGEFITFNQCQKLGKRIKAGSKARKVVFWSMFKKEQTRPDGSKEEIVIPTLRWYGVFNIKDVEGLEPKWTKEKEEVLPIEHRIEKAEKVKTDYLQRSGVGFEECFSSEAFYSPMRDFIKVPHITQYKDPAEYYSTTFHEMVHSTGHHSRLKRIDTKANAAFGSSDYSREELVAEIGSSMVCGHLEISSAKSFRNSVGYIQGWLKTLRGDNRAIVVAAGKAEKAANLILGIQAENTQGEE